MVKRVAEKIVWDLKVVADFKEILTYFKHQNTRAPKLVKKAVFERIDSLKDNPFLFGSDRLKRPPVLRIRHSGQLPLE